MVYTHIIYVMEYPYSGILFSSKKEWTTRICYNMDDVQKHYANRKKPDAKAYILHDSIYVKLRAHKIDQWLPRTGNQSGDYLQMSLRKFSEVMEMFKTWIVVIHTLLCTFIKNHWIIHLKQNDLEGIQYLNKAVTKEN
jgi:hypothetical protein